MVVVTRLSSGEEEGVFSDPLSRLPSTGWMAVNANPSIFVDHRECPLYAIGKNGEVWCSVIGEDKVREILTLIVPSENRDILWKLASNVLSVVNGTVRLNEQSSVVTIQDGNGKMISANRRTGGDSVDELVRTGNVIVSNVLAQAVLTKSN
jgi:hypothetical protein